MIGRPCQVSADEVDLRVHSYVDFAAGTVGELLEGVEQGWLEAFSRLDAALTSAQTAADREGLVA